MSFMPFSSANASTLARRVARGMPESGFWILSTGDAPGIRASARPAETRRMEGTRLALMLLFRFTCSTCPISLSVDLRIQAPIVSSPPALHPRVRCDRRGGPKEAVILTLSPSSRPSLQAASKEAGQEAVRSEVGQANSSTHAAPRRLICADEGATDARRTKLPVIALAASSACEPSSTLLDMMRLDGAW